MLYIVTAQGSIVRLLHLCEPEILGMCVSHQNIVVILHRPMLIPSIGRRRPRHVPRAHHRALLRPHRRFTMFSGIPIALFRLGYLHQLRGYSSIIFHSNFNYL